LTPTPDDFQLLLGYEWPGNVRELAAVIERAAILGRGRQLRIADALGVAAVAGRSEGSERAAELPSAPSRESELLTLARAMGQHIERALEQTGGRIEGAAGAAARLGINPHTLRARMRKLGVVWHRFRGASQPPVSASDAPLTTLDVAMAAHIRRALELTRGRIEGRNGAASRLDINPHTLRARMRKLGIDARMFRDSRHGVIGDA
jgi:DNA-binding NtrC family response regulator